MDPTELSAKKKKISEILNLNNLFADVLLHTESKL